jgi:hypothetical protein
VTSHDVTVARHDRPPLYAMTDHHSEYLARTVAAFTPEGRARVDELLGQLLEAAGGRTEIVRFGQALKGEADSGATNPAAEDAAGRALSGPELDRLLSGFITIRDQEPLDDVGDWANAVIALLEDELRRPGRPGDGS